MMREKAVSILVKVKVEQGYANILINDVLKQSTLNNQDKALLTRIVYGTIQNEIYLDYQLSFYIKNKKIKPFEKQLLLMSFYQIIYLNKVPSYAIINEAVEIAKRKRGLPTSKFVNAILRRFNREGIKEVEASSLEEYLSITMSHPLWIVKLLHKQYGLEVTKRILEENQTTPNATARVNTLVTSREEIMKQNDCFIIGNISKDALLYTQGHIASTTLYNKGFLTVQDESSQLVSLLLAPKEGSVVLDMCSAPGSKTTHLAQLMKNTGKIIAYDIHEHKIRLVNDNCERLHIHNVETKVYDSTKLNEVYSAETFDYILLDAPCSGLGVIKRKPEIKYHDSSVMDTLIPLQKELLEVAYFLLKKSGELVYSTCTLNKKENDMLVEMFLKQHEDIEKLYEKTILPYEYQSDGFYMCKLKKR